MLYNIWTIFLKKFCVEQSTYWICLTNAILHVPTYADSHRNRRQILERIASSSKSCSEITWNFFTFWGIVYFSSYLFRFFRERYLRNFLKHKELIHKTWVFLILMYLGKIKRFSKVWQSNLNIFSSNFSACNTY